MKNAFQEFRKEIPSLTPIVLNTKPTISSGPIPSLTCCAIGLGVYYKGFLQPVLAIPIRGLLKSASVNPMACTWLCRRLRRVLRYIFTVLIQHGLSIINQKYFYRQNPVIFVRLLNICPTGFFAYKQLNYSILYSKKLNTQELNI